MFYAVFLIDGPDEYRQAISAVLSSLMSVDDRLEDCPCRDGLPGGLLLQRPFKVEPEDASLYEFASILSDTISADAMCRVLIGYDKCADDPDNLSLALEHARRAVDIGRRFDLSSPILPYFDLGLAKLVYALSPEARREYIRDNLGSFRFSDLDSETLSTIHTFFETGLSLAKTAKVLFVHRNTLNYRIDKFQKLSGLNLRNFDDAVVCQIAMLIQEETNLEF